jgi:hypothetical protein
MLKDIQSWFGKRVPAEWFEALPDVSGDADEIVVIGRLREADATGKAREAACVDAIKRFREETRERRIAIAGEAEARFRRHVAWGAECGDTRMIFTSNSVPVMTRLRLPERMVLDTLIESGVARTRSDALAWCARLVGQHEGDWLRDLRNALVEVQKVRAAGPQPRREDT